MLPLLPRRGRRVRAAILAIAVGACGSAVATTACADRLTTLGSLSLAVAPTALRVVAGRADSVTVRVLRGGGFAGTVALSVVPPASAPAGLAVTLDAPALEFPGDVIRVRITAAAGTPPGTYVYDVQAVGEGGAMSASRSVAVTVDAAPAIGVALDSATMRLPQGATRTTTVTVTRGGGFTGMVLLAVDTALVPRGVRATFTPSVIPIGATTATLELRADATAAPTGATPFALVVRASGFAVAERTTTLALTIVGAGAAVQAAP